ncbi:N-acetyl-gamma-glutamyl-phosphate reductase (AGPR) (N- acetyl-glutamate semialdehyde dehydrogenase) (NAGSA dehydrogenase) [Bradyrhizobium sp. ORS 285]|uniref:N-acetyl-gamma-glutamyl-phosphate reductase n=1 Tax=Bradyrhizobium sp. ORS 285 TaxID=115808 RepID=UPI0002407F4B|nr:N-acetyl-gamma-glutamyl-phosphate reductase [Bradyrhizobium sp. ORS 285]CCD90274.1 N-acetyl-gamma-glutamyl-phosphate reductase (AGPR) (N-acetyl-glutamate semialdehyde dehydrogenase) (NAGSA dehydrogenase) [Bradyrhizobium sp. ORS 285]SMX61108.1 N-acetyl-gamma-glutamyl-phosphate reductase (AGPR) (N- acetyl-glutamate semialdehyde dehydrogenase) (NAGSA dehydrogenase) [Bradyrhizobium sp. ORS 285]
MSIRVGIVGISGFGGGEAMRLIAGHPSFELVYAAGEGSAGQRLVERFPGVPAKLADLVIEKWDPARLPPLDVLFASLPTGASRDALARIPREVKIVDIGGDHRYADGWTYGLADVWPEAIAGKTRIANPGCFPAAALTALAPLLADRLIAPENIVIDAKTGISGAGRGGGAGFGYAESNENLIPYGLLKHVHMPEIESTIARISGGSAAGLVFTPHLVPMTRGILATIYARGRATSDQCLDAARSFYAGRAFVRVTDKPPQTKWATGSNLAFVSYAADPARNLVIALGVVDNLGKGAAGQAVQNANLMCGLPETAGLEGAPVWP